MAETSIEWTERTWNPILGCSIATPGCTNCYAMKMAGRLEAMGTGRYAGTTRKVNSKSVWTGKLSLAPDSTFNDPLTRRRPTTYFVNSMGDLFHEDCPDTWIDRVFEVMSLARPHTFQVLTKRAARMHAYMRVRKPLPNVWLGVSTERQKEADERIPLLLATPAVVRFISAEPLLGALNIRNFVKRASERNPSLNWVIVGGESGHGARPMRAEWVESLHAQCDGSDAAFFFKQWGGKNKKAAGRLLNGQVYDALPSLSM
jgi:protein gp37